MSAEGESKGKFKMYVLLYIIGSQKKYVRLVSVFPQPSNTNGIASVKRPRCHRGLKSSQ